MHDESVAAAPGVLQIGPDQLLHREELVETPVQVADDEDPDASRHRGQPPKNGRLCRRGWLSAPEQAFQHRWSHLVRPLRARTSTIDAAKLHLVATGRHMARKRLTRQHRPATDANRSCHGRYVSTITSALRCCLAALAKSAKPWRTRLYCGVHPRARAATATRLTGSLQPAGRSALCQGAFVCDRTGGIMNPTIKRTAATLALTTALSASGMAVAQQNATQTDDPDPNVTVQDRERPEYDPLGIRAGSFLIYPSLSLSGQYDSNVFTTSDDEESDVALITSPQVQINSNWSRHALNFAAGATGAVNKEYSENNYLDAYAAATGRLDVRRDDIVSGTLRFDRLHEDRDDPDNETGEDNRGNLVRYYSGLIDGQYRHNFARFFTVVGAGVKRLEYEDIGDRELSNRNRTEYGGRGRLGYQLSPRIGTFVQGNLSYRDYDDDQIINGVEADRSSTGYRASVGTTVDITSILFGEMSVGYEGRNYETSELKDSGGFGANGALTWNVTPLTSVILDASSGVDETTVTFEGDTAEADLENQVGLDVTHELLRNLLLNANARYTRNDFQGTSRVDNTYDLGGGVTYLINRNLSVDATYRFTTRDSDDGEAEFDRNLVLIGITARL
jgi:hypothetical protein